MNSLIPMFSVTGNPDKKILYQKLKAFHDNNIHAVMIYPRSGLEVEYMSPQWFDICETMIETAKNFSMDVWLYDEFNWPSGSCKNSIVSQNETFYAKCLVFQDGTLFIDQVKEEYCGRIFDPFENDMLNPDAVDQFIRMTHEQYFARFKDYFGTTIKGFFTDEPSFIYTSSAPNIYPYYEGLEEDYEQICGRKFLNDMENYLNHNGCNDFMIQYRHLIGERFRNCYVKKVAGWCKEHGIELTGHFLDDDSIYNSVTATGNLFACLKEMDTPGIDDINTDLSPGILYPQIEWIRQSGKSHAMAELFALGPCSMTYAERRRMIWYAAVHGVNRFFLAISHLNAKGNIRKPDFFSNFSETSPDFIAMKKLVESTEKAILYADKTSVKNVYIRYPYSQCLKELSIGDTGNSDNLLKKLFSSLRNLQVQYLLIDENKTVDAPVILTIKDHKIIDEVSGIVIDNNLEYFLRQSGKWFDMRPVVTESNNRLAENILIRQYTDDSILIIDTTPATENTAARRELILNNCGKCHNFLLEKYGIYEFIPKNMNTKVAEPRMENVIISDIQDVSLERCGDNLLRCMFFQSNTFIFETTETAIITVNTRIYPEQGIVFLDDMQIHVDQRCSILTDCFNSLYASSQPIILPPGKHKIRTTLKEYLHLPAVIISGSFNRIGNTLLPDIKDYNNIYTFWGQMKVHFTLEVPANAKKALLCLADTGMCVEGTFEDAYTSENLLCAFAPYEFDIPEKLFGRQLSVTLTFSSSLAPIFGDIMQEDKTQNLRAEWVKTAPLSIPEVLETKTLGIKFRWW